MLSRLAPALLLLAAACGGPEFDVRAQEVEGLAFFPQVVDVEQDAGPGLSITTDADGSPHLAYLKLPLKAEQPEAPDPLAPILPAVAHAHLVDDIWTHSEVAESPTEDEGGAALALTAEDETAIAVDPEGTHHVAWTEDRKRLMYSNDPTGETEPQVIDTAEAVGLSIWADEKGIPWVAFYELVADPEGPTALVRLATVSGETWEVETVAEADADAGYTGSGVGPGADGPVIAYTDASGVQLASRQGNRWASELIDEEGDAGVSMDVDADGNPHISYATADGGVRHAHSIGGGPWEISEVASGANPVWTSIAVHDAGTHHVAWHTQDGIGYANNAAGEFAEVELPPAAAGGTRPRVAAGTGSVYLAWHNPQGTRLILGTYGEEQPLLAVPSPTGVPADGGGGGLCEPEGDTLTIAAESLQFTEDCLAVQAGQPFTIEFDNRDAAQHNVAIYTAAPPEGDTLFQGEVVTQTSITYDVEPIAEPGEFYFHCDVHPIMNGTFVVAE